MSWVPGGSESPPVLHADGGEGVVEADDLGLVPVERAHVALTDGIAEGDGHGHQQNADRVGQSLAEQEKNPRENPRDQGVEKERFGYGQRLSDGPQLPRKRSQKKK